MTKLSRATSENPSSPPPSSYAGESSGASLSFEASNAPGDQNQGEKKRFLGLDLNVDPNDGEMKDINRSFKTMKVKQSLSERYRLRHSVS